LSGGMMGVICGAKCLANPVHQAAVNPALDQHLPCLRTIKVMRAFGGPFDFEVKLTCDLSNCNAYLFFGLLNPDHARAVVPEYGIHLLQAVLPCGPRHFAKPRA